MGFSNRQITKGSVPIGEIRRSLVQDPWARTLYVQSVHTRASDSKNSGRDFNAPLKTLARAIVLAAARDRILIGPGHSETITSGTGLAVNKAGLQIIGLGGPTDAPLITIAGTVTTAANAVVVSAANVKFNNIRFGCGLDLLTTIVIVAGGAGGGVFEDCFLETSGAVQPVSGIVIEDVNCRISRLRVPNGTGFESAGSVQAILISTTGADFCTIEDCEIYGDFSAANIANTAAVVNLQIVRNRLTNLNAVDTVIDIGAVATTGMIAHNLMRIATDAQTTWILQGAGSLMSLFENYGVNNNQETGILEGTPSI